MRTIAFIIFLALILSMSITHSSVKTSGSKGTADEWNDDHVVTDESKPKNFTTLIVAASNSLDTTRADYVCDGIDDQDTINAAMAALPAGGGRISLLEGTYQITNPISIPDDDITIMGLGAATIIQTSDNIVMVTAANRSNILIADIRIIGAGAGHNSNVALFLDTCTESSVRGIWIEQAGAMGVFFETCDFVTIRDAFMTGNIEAGMYLYKCNYCVIDNVISNSNGAGFDGLYLRECTYCKVLNSYFDDNDRGIDVLGNSEHNTIMGCTSINNADTGIVISALSVREIVTNNMVTGNAVAQITDLGANTVVSNNQVV